MRNEPYNFADVRFNSGNGALLCNRCSVIIAYGFDHEDKFHFCDRCQNTELEKMKAEDA